MSAVSVLVCVVLAAAALFRREFRSRLLWPACAAAALSLAVTLAYVVDGARSWWGAEVSGMVESLVLMALGGLVIRYAPPRRAVPGALLVGAASSVWMLRFFVPASPLEGVGVCAFWGTGALLAAGIGAYLRLADVRQQRAVADARTALRLRLARDLHDFVAHDISEMVAYAQAGGVAGDPRQALERVEAAGQRAMSMLDRTLDMLHHDRPRTPVGDLSGIREAADRFSAAGPARVHLSMDAPETVPAEIAALAYRIVVEGLTNIRRHAPHAGRADLSISAAGDVLEVTLSNDGVNRSPGRRNGGGSGLAGLAALVREQGGELVTRAVPDGWSLTARLPLAQSHAWPPESSSPTTRKASAAPSGSSSTPSPT
ncbi:histidine kinase [Nonomuraea sp. NPDC050404]|uniref:sensor histidine kinase n=1 Tax=Nonomuraea sp. NPDC050404 TaxID=3155783 RepID=UPI0033E5256D